MPIPGRRLSVASVSRADTPATMMDPGKLEDGDTWLHDCEVCTRWTDQPVPIQGGMPGLVAHVATVHT